MLATPIGLMSICPFAFMQTKSDLGHGNYFLRFLSYELRLSWKCFFRKLQLFAIFYKEQEIFTDDICLEVVVFSTKKRLQVICKANFTCRKSQIHFCLFSKQKYFLVDCCHSWFYYRSALVVGGSFMRNWLVLINGWKKSLFPTKVFKGLKLVKVDCYF